MKGGKIMNIRMGELIKDVAAALGSYYARSSIGMNFYNCQGVA
jgi:hypothetical protein